MASMSRRKLQKHFNVRRSVMQEQKQSLDVQLESLQARKRSENKREILLKTPELGIQDDLSVLSVSNLGEEEAKDVQVFSVRNRSVQRNPPVFQISSKSKLSPRVLKKRLQMGTRNKQFAFNRSVNHKSLNKDKPLMSFQNKIPELAEHAENCFNKRKIRFQNPECLPSLLNRTSQTKSIQKKETSKQRPAS